MGMCTAQFPLSTVAHHPFGSGAKGLEMLALLDAKEAYVAAFGHCSTFGAGGVMLAEGLLSAECLCRKVEDPHLKFVRQDFSVFCIYDDFEITESELVSRDKVLRSQMASKEHGNHSRKMYVIQRLKDIGSTWKDIGSTW
jgi:hypothetical protein